MGVGKRALEALAEWDLDAYEACLDEAAVEHRPQTSERFVGRSNIIDMYRSLPGPPPLVSWHRFVESEGSCIGFGRIRYSPDAEPPDHVIASTDTRDGRVVAAAFYFAAPLPPIASHENWSEPDD